MEECKCKKCGYEWKPRVEKPIECPKCKCYDWSKEITNSDRKV